MAEQVTLRSQECQTAYESVKQFHQEQRTSFLDGLAKIKEILNRTDGFHANQINDKVLFVLDLVEGQIVPQLDHVFEQSETSYQKLLSALAEEDQRT